MKICVKMETSLKKMWGAKSQERREFFKNIFRYDFYLNSWHVRKTKCNLKFFDLSKIKIDAKFSIFASTNNFICPFKMEKSTAAATALITLIKSIREGKLCTPKLIPQGHLSLFFNDNLIMIFYHSQTFSILHYYLIFSSSFNMLLYWPVL